MRPLPGPGDRDTGVVAVLVALSVSTFVLGFAALAVDLGTAYTRRADLQSIGDRLALAGARGLPSVPDALASMSATLHQICVEQPNIQGICPDTPVDRGDPSEPGIAWATDGIKSNGEVSFLHDGNGDGRYGAGDVFSGIGAATALQVRLPPSTVQFGLASAIGVPSETMQRSATARIGTPLGLGVLPFALTQADVDRGTFCVRDHTFTPPTTDPLVTLGINGTPGKLDRAAADLDLLLTPGDGTAINRDSVVFHLGSGGTGVIRRPPGAAVITGANAGANPFRVALPKLPTDPTNPAADPDSLWASGTLTDGAPFTTDVQPLIYKAPATGPAQPPGTPPLLIPPTATSNGLCSRPEADRGFVALARSVPGTALTDLEHNVRAGPAVGLLDPQGTGTVITGVVDCADSVPAPATTCVTPQLLPEGFGDSMTKGFLAPTSGNETGRLLGGCGAGTTDLNGHDVDNSNLFGPGSGLIDPILGGSGSTLEQRLSTNVPRGGATSARRGWITSPALRCPRMALMPVVSALPVGVPTGTLTGGQVIQGFKYVWIDGDEADGTPERGLAFGDDGSLGAFSGYVIDPSFLPGTVSGSPRVGPYMGQNMPKEALLTPDWTGMTR